MAYDRLQRFANDPYERDSDEAGEGGGWPGKRTRAGELRVQRSGGGSALPDDARSHFEQAFGADFSDVRVHHGDEAASLGARAYTRGSDIHFAPGEWDPNGETGRSLLGHELTHVIQQRGGRVALPQGKGAPIQADAGLEAEADAMGARAARGEHVHVAGAAVGAQPKLADAPIQRAVGFELQMTWPIYEKEGEEWQPLPRGRALFKDASGKLAGPPPKVEQGGTFNFVVETDDGDEGAEAEFVTAPFEEKNDIKLAAHNMNVFEQAIGATGADGDGFRHLDQVVASFRGKIDGAVDPRDADKTLRPSTKAVNNAADIGFGSKKKAGWFDDKEGRGQATLSAKLTDFNQVLALFDIQAPVIGDERVFGNAALYNAALERARRVSAGLPIDQDWGRLTGLLSLVIGSLWCAASFFLPDEPDYVKSLFKMMLRNPFSHIYGRLRGHEKGMFSTAWVLGILGMDGDGKVFPTGFKVEDNDNGYFGPTRKEFLDSVINPATGNDKAREGDQHVVGMNVKEEDYPNKHQWELGKQDMQETLNQKDLLSRGWVKASAYSMGEVPFEANQMVRAEWRGFHPNYIGLDKFEEAATDVFDRATAPRGAIQPPVPYDHGKRKRMTVPAHVIPDLKLVELDSRRPVTGPDDLLLVREVYEITDNTLFRLVDVSSPGGEEGKPAGEFETDLRDKVAPNFLYTFETVFREDLAELKGVYREDYEADAFPSETGEEGTFKKRPASRSPSPSPSPSPSRSPSPEPSRSRSVSPEPSKKHTKSRKTEHGGDMTYEEMVRTFGEGAANFIISNTHDPSLVGRLFAEEAQPDVYWKLTSVGTGTIGFEYVGAI